MTKQVRIENADTTAYKVVVEVWDKGIDGGPDTLAKTAPLPFPTALAVEYITSTRYLVVKEAE
jgi:hypothetical protein